MSFDSAAYLRTEHAQHLTVANELLAKVAEPFDKMVRRSEEHTSELQSH